MARGKHGVAKSGTHGRTTFHLPVKGRTKGNGMGGHKRGINRKHRSPKNRGGGR